MLAHFYAVNNSGYHAFLQSPIALGAIGVSGRDAAVPQLVMRLIPDDEKSELRPKMVEHNARVMP